MGDKLDFVVLSVHIS